MPVAGRAKTKLDPFGSRLLEMLRDYLIKAEDKFPCFHMVISVQSGCLQHRKAILSARK